MTTAEAAQLARALTGSPTVLPPMSAERFEKRLALVPAAAVESPHEDQRSWFYDGHLAVIMMILGMVLGAGVAIPATYIFVMI